ncbi:ABC transporter ATP-binding protein [Brevibacterium sp. Re57]|uniref:ABC transporter ATP-binding protein n=1 Tax=Brevibacterium gallinarum TaxID=2762220 RepID=A0ABR8WTW1_9MICO|nr:ABC transporter ATP-binding protein [Brevibacterium gallinarum]
MTRSTSTGWAATSRTSRKRWQVTITDSDSHSTNPVLELSDAQLRFGDRVLWHNLNIDVEPGEFIAILGPNGCGKTSLLKVLLGQYQLYSGTARVNGHRARRGDPDIGYIPQQRGIDDDTPMRGRDLVRMGLDGHRWGPGWFSRSRSQKVEALLEEVGAQTYADSPVGMLSGGELQRLRVAQALGSDPHLLLCDEPLLHLDMTHQRLVARLLHEKRQTRQTAILFVTHEINPILPYVDRVLYIAGGHFLVGTPDEVINSTALSELYGSPIDVVRAGGRIVIVGSDSDHHPIHHPEPSAGAI